MDAKELAEIERAMEEEHQRDREALERLKRFLPRNNGNSVRTPTIPRFSTPKDDLETAAVYTFISRVAEIMTSDPSRTWDGPRMLERLTRVGSPVQAKRPLGTVNRVFRKLVKRGVIQRVRKGTGTTPHTYRAVQKKELPERAVRLED